MHCCVSFPQKSSKVHLWSHWWPPWQSTKVYILAVACVGQLNKIMPSAIMTPGPQHEGCQSWAVSPLLPSSLTCATSVNRQQVKAWIHTLLHKLVGNGVLGEGRTRSLTCSPCSILKPLLCLLVISVCSSTWARVQHPWTLHKYLVVSCDCKCTPIIFPSTLQIKWLYLFNKQFPQLIQ